MRYPASLSGLVSRNPSAVGKESAPRLYKAAARSACGTGYARYGEWGMGYGQEELLAAAGFPMLGHAIVGGRRVHQRWRLMVGADRDSAQPNSSAQFV